MGKDMKARYFRGVLWRAVNSSDWLENRMRKKRIWDVGAMINRSPISVWVLNRARNKTGKGGVTLVNVT